MSTPYIVICLFIIGIIIFGIITYRKSFKKHPTITDPILHNLLIANVAFYQEIPDKRKSEFRLRVNKFLEHTRITMVDKSKVTDLDRALIGASAIIPIFNFPKWEYSNLNEVLLYNDSFNYQFQTDGAGRNILGMVGNGALHSTMLLSRKALYDGFHEHATSNTSIHEFVHLIDMTDGAVDGIPKYLIPKSLIEPWMHEIYTTTQDIINDEVAIRKYATVNEAEFLSVVSEYFFIRPHKLQEEDPELYALLKKIYNMD